ncbi:uncharacterized protein LOC129293693 [Prosopis cineraria]|uniref:uncharacterized protein LOC129293693 n=1 Tax=Prosopis cineraria TaxID=364024 RepID=UPI00240F361C|nr:uncharacterized protein LOC129293693 [Prosopis cineraria]
MSMRKKKASLKISSSQILISLWSQVETMRNDYGNFYSFSDFSMECRSRVLHALINDIVRMSSLGASDTAGATLASSGNHPHGGTPVGVPEMEFPLLSSEDVKPLKYKDNMMLLPGWVRCGRRRVEIQDSPGRGLQSVKVKVLLDDWLLPGRQMTFNCDVADQLISKDSGLLTLIVADTASISGGIIFSISWLTKEHSTCTETTAATFVPASEEEEILGFRTTWRQAWDATLGRNDGNAANHAVQEMVDTITRKQSEQPMGGQNVLALIMSDEIVTWLEDGLHSLPPEIAVYV